MHPPKDDLNKVNKNPQGQKSSGAAGRYQKMMPITAKNIGKDYLKGSSKYVPHQGKREIERRQKQAAKALAKQEA